MPFKPILLLSKFEYIPLMKTEYDQSHIVSFCSVVPVFQKWAECLNYARWVCYRAKKEIGWIRFLISCWLLYYLLKMLMTNHFKHAKNKFNLCSLCWDIISISISINNWWLSFWISNNLTFHQCTWSISNTILFHRYFDHLAIKYILQWWGRLHGAGL